MTLGAYLGYCWFMAKKAKDKKKLSNTEKIEKEREFRHLETLLKYSLKAIDGRSGPIDELFTEQAYKVKKKLREISDLH